MLAVTIHDPVVTTLHCASALHVSWVRVLLQMYAQAPISSLPVSSSAAEHQAVAILGLRQRPPADPLHSQRSCRDLRD